MEVVVKTWKKQPKVRIKEATESVFLAYKLYRKGQRPEASVDIRKLDKGEDDSGMPSDFCCC